jgi:hypothetical protein
MRRPPVADHIRRGTERSASGNFRTKSFAFPSTYLFITVLSTLMILTTRRHKLPLAIASQLLASCRSVSLELAYTSAESVS